MSSLRRRDQGGDILAPFNRMERLFDEWMRAFPMRRPFGPGGGWPGEDLIRVDQFHDGPTEVIRAELPGVDPAKDVELTVTDGMLRIHAERRVEEKTEERDYVRHEMRHGTLTRTLPLPEGVSGSDITATYKDGILEIRIPVPTRPQPEPTRIQITKG
jgi:HSP20 family protein